MTVREAYRYLKRSLAFLGQQEAEAEALEALQEIGGVAISDLLLAPKRALSELQIQSLQSLVARRENGEPLAYIKTAAEQK